MKSNAPIEISESESRSALEEVVNCLLQAVCYNADSMEIIFHHRGTKPTELSQSIYILN